MSSNDNVQLHPNWRALATVNYPVKRFVRGQELQSQTERHVERPNLTVNDGEETRKFYEDLTKESNTKRPTMAPPTFISKLSTTKDTPLLKFDCHKFFRFATTNNTKDLARLDCFENDINVCDEFGWSGIMMAACAGAIDVVRMLLQLGADKNIKDKAGRTALDLAQLKGHSNIVEMLQKDYVEFERISASSTIIPNEPFYCNTCNYLISDTSCSQHLTSTVHQFNVKSNATKNKLNKFNITTRNRGLQLMVKQGWDRESGLGPTSSGRLYPIKTVIRKNRTGLGTAQEPARVTHFSAFDLRAVENSNFKHGPTHKNRSRNDIRIEKVREWKRDRRLRKELS